MNTLGWNFMNFRPGLVGGHCLPVDPYYLSSMMAKKDFKTEVILAGRKINDNMAQYASNEILKVLKKKIKLIFGVQLIRLILFCT